LERAIDELQGIVPIEGSQPGELEWELVLDLVEAWRAYIFPVPFFVASECLLYDNIDLTQNREISIIRGHELLCEVRFTWDLE
jgi:hypothetical protein